MDIVDAIRTRKSVRGFKPEPVPKEILSEILKIAVHAPSAMNIQPWEFTMISGEVLENVRRNNVEKLSSGEQPHPDCVMASWPADSVYRVRQVELAKKIFQLMEIRQEEKEKKARWAERGFRYFDAPAAIIISVDRSLSEAGPLLDIGAVMQNICLAALNYGLGTCVENQGLMYPDVLRKFTGLPESKRIVITIAIGYPDPYFPANKLESGRGHVDNTTTWCGFE
ncbi:MAG: nitroreductase [Syntrophales bacterium]